MTAHIAEAGKQLVYHHLKSEGLLVDNPKDLTKSIEKGHKHIELQPGTYNVELTVPEDVELTCQGGSAQFTSVNLMEGASIEGLLIRKELQVEGENSITDCEVQGSFQADNVTLVRFKSTLFYDDVAITEAEEIHMEDCQVEGALVLGASSAYLVDVYAKNLAHIQAFNGTIGLTSTATVLDGKNYDVILSARTPNDNSLVILGSRINIQLRERMGVKFTEQSKENVLAFSRSYELEVVDEGQGNQAALPIPIQVEEPKRRNYLMDRPTFKPHAVYDIQSLEVGSLVDFLEDVSGNGRHLRAHGDLPLVVLREDGLKAIRFHKSAPLVYAGEENEPVDKLTMVAGCEVDFPSDGNQRYGLVAFVGNEYGHGGDSHFSLSWVKNKNNTVQNKWEFPTGVRFLRGFFEQPQRHYFMVAEVDSTLEKPEGIGMAYYRDGDLISSSKPDKEVGSQPCNLGTRNIALGAFYYHANGNPVKASHPIEITHFGLFNDALLSAEPSNVTALAHNCLKDAK